MPPCVPPGACPNPIIGTFPKNAGSPSNIPVPVAALITGHFVYCSDGCNDPGFQAGQNVVVQPPPVAPLLSPQMIVVLVASLALVGLVGLARMRLNR
jgi:hypothetical protein